MTESVPRRILIAEDSPVQAKLLQRLLESHDFDVRVARNGAEALDQLRANGADLVLTDVNMPVMDGIELCQNIKRAPELAAVKVIMVTTLSGPEEILEGVRAGADDYVIKPYREDYLLRKITGLHGQKEKDKDKDKDKDRDAYSDVSSQHFVRLLLSTYENAVQQNSELRDMQLQLSELNHSLEEQVAARTKELTDSNAQLRETLGELHRTQASVIQSEKMAAVGTLVAGVAHEMNNPLMGAINYVEYLKDRVSDEKMLTYLEKTDAAIQRVAAIVKGMLSFSHQPSEELSAVNCYRAVEGMLDLVSADFRHKGIRINVQIPEDLPLVRANMVGLQQVILNLLVNARDAMEDAEVREITILGSASGSSVTLTVSDTGSGVPADKLGQIFDPFFTTKPVGKGTGLGLAISKNVIRSFGGDLSYDSVGTAGATFRVQLESAIARPGNGCA